MVLNNFNFFYKKYQSPASRNITYFFSENLIFKKHKKLTLKIKNKSGRSKNGNIIFRTKTSNLIKIKKIHINYSLNYRQVGTIAAFSFIPFKNKLTTLVYFCNGFVTYFLANNYQKLFSFFYNKVEKKIRKFSIKSSHFFIFQLKKLSFVSYLEIFPGKGAQYVRSSGTKGKLMSFDSPTHSCIIKLPSGIKKIFSQYSFVFLGSLAMSLHKRRLNGKAGFWRTYGKKPIVRGVAMNAVDHPHGGRTKSIKTPLTPWGKITKFK